MGQMKSYQMFLEERGYVEYVDLPDGTEDYENTPMHPGDDQALQEFLDDRDKGRVPPPVNDEEFCLPPDDDTAFDECDGVHGDDVREGMDATYWFKDDGGLTADAYNWLAERDSEDGFC